MSTVYVAGAAVMDVIAHADHHPRTAETVIGRDLGFFPGGKGYNQAIAAARIGASTWFMGAVGADAFGRDLREYLEAEGINTTGIYTANSASGAALINVDTEGQVAVNVVYGANELADPGILQGFSPRAGDVLISQLEIPYPTVEAFFERGRNVGARTICNLAPAREANDRIVELSDIVVVNEVELSFFSGVPITDDASREDVAAAALKLRRFDEQWIVATLGRRGAVAVHADDIFEIPGVTVEVRNTIGAGDCFVGSMGACLARGSGVVDAIQYANAAAAISVQRDGAGPAMPFGDEVDAFLTR
ncbi:MAG: ribokinase [Acidimicrobiia bacterium]